jgi:GAF domain-containing protein
MTHPAARSGLLRTAAGLAYAVMHMRRGAMARPTDGAVVRSGPQDADARRILLVANGIGHGWGVPSHRSAPTGLLAEAVAARDGAPCEVAFVGDAAMNAQTAPLWVEGRADASFDGAVIAIGSNDALRLTTVDEWTAGLAELLDTVRSGLPDRAPVVVVGVPEIYVAQRVRRMSVGFRLRARRFDAATRRLVAERPGTAFLPAPDLSAHLGAEPDAALYAAFAGPVADAVAPLIASGAALAPAMPEAFAHDDVRTVVEAARERTLQTLQDVVDRAQARFGVMESAVTLVDGDRTWHVAHSGRSPVQAPSALTLCPVVTGSDEAVIVENIRQDPRFADNAFLEVQHARFYAGAPVHAADGTAIGAVCLFHAFPRSERRVDLDALRSFALEAETAIRELVAARAGVGTAVH